VCSSDLEEIVEILGVTEYFDAVCGSTFDGSRKDKKDLIPYAVESLGGNIETDRKRTVMLGDTYFDARVARLCKADFVGVKYGYGSIKAMQDEGASLFADTPKDILKLIGLQAVIIQKPAAYILILICICAEVFKCLYLTLR